MAAAYMLKPGRAGAKASILMAASSMLKVCSTLSVPSGRSHFRRLKRSCSLNRRCSGRANAFSPSCQDDS
eukprot:6204685-Pleurochrysis_carterae.AAC.2